MKRVADAKALKKLQETLAKQWDPKKPLVTICAGTGCRGYGCVKVKEALEQEIVKQKLKVEVKATGCFGFCEKGPLVVIYPQKILKKQDSWVGKFIARVFNVPNFIPNNCCLHYVPC